jgi:cyclic-di-GMP-binding protein
VDQASREVGQRFDFKGTDAKFELKEHVITLSAPADFQLKQMLEILRAQAGEAGIDVACLKVDEPVTTARPPGRSSRCGRASRPSSARSCSG